MNIRNARLTFVIPMALLSPLLLSTNTLAQEDPAAIIEALDADGSGGLSQSEAAVNEMLFARFGDLDANEDGEVTAEELAVLAE